MNITKDSIPLNRLGQRHGYWKIHYSNGPLAGSIGYRGHFFNNNRIGFHERYFTDQNGIKATKIYYII